MMLILYVFISAIATLVCYLLIYTKLSQISNRLKEQSDYFRTLREQEEARRDNERKVNPPAE